MALTCQHTIFDHFVKQKEAEKKVQYVTHIERKGIETGRLAGLTEGIKTGLVDGLKTGRADGLKTGRAEMLLRLLEEKFGTLDPDIQTTVYRLDENHLFEWLKRSLKAESLQEVIGQL